MAGMIVLIITALLAVWVIAMYNGLVTLKNQVQNAWKQIDVQLKRRYDLIPNLVNTVKGAMEFERETLEKVMELRPDRAAVYSFAFVPEVRPHQRRLPKETLPQGMTKLKLFAQARRAFLGSGYVAIGMDHFALPSDELARAQKNRTLRRNFQGYTVATAEDVIAFGVTAISDVQGVFVQNVRPLPRYYACVTARKLPVDRGFVLSEDDRRRRRVIESLFCNFWADLGPDAGSYFERELSELGDFAREGLVRVGPGEVELTEAGHLLVRNVAMVFDTHLRAASERPVFSRTV